jgi:hypothetical protein
VLLAPLSRMTLCVGEADIPAALRLTLLLLRLKEWDVELDRRRMLQAKFAPFGSWKSPITSDLIVTQVTMLSEARLAGDDVYWLEGRPQEEGRTVRGRVSGNSPYWTWRADRFGRSRLGSRNLDR